MTSAVRIYDFHQEVAGRKEGRKILSPDEREKGEGGREGGQTEEIAAVARCQHRNGRQFSYVSTATAKLTAKLANTRKRGSG